MAEKKDKARIKRVGFAIRRLKLLSFSSEEEMRLRKGKETFNKMEIRFKTPKGAEIYKEVNSFITIYL